jgi:hypothetical protein
VSATPGQPEDREGRPEAVGSAIAATRPTNTSTTSSTDRYEEILLAHLAAEKRTRSKRRHLDGEFYDNDWLLAG